MKRLRAEKDELHEGQERLETKIRQLNREKNELDEEKESAKR